MNSRNGVKNCIILARVSNPISAKEGNSFENQDIVARRIAKKNGWNVRRVFDEPYSASKGERPFYVEEVLPYLKKHKDEIGFAIVLSIDRFTRSGAFEYEKLKRELERYGVTLIDSHGIIQPTQNLLEHLDVKYSWSEFSPSKTAELITANESQNEVTRILTRMIGAEINLARRGYQVRTALDGYVNKKVFVGEEGASKKRTIPVADPDRAEYFIEIFQLRASGFHADEEIVEILNNKGFKTKPKNKWDKWKTKIIGVRPGQPLTIKHLQRIIKNPRYCGYAAEAWTNYQPIKLASEGLVSVVMFNAASRGKVFIKDNGTTPEIIYNNNPDNNIKRRLKSNPLFPFKNIVRCPVCSKPFLGSSPKGKSGKRFPTYHCARGHKYFGVNKKKFEKITFDFVKQLELTPEAIEHINEVFIAVFRREQKKLLPGVVQNGQHVIDLENEVLELVEKWKETDNSIIREILDKQITEVSEKIKIRQQKRNELEITESDIQKFIEEAQYLMEHPENLLINQANIQAQQQLFGLIFDEFPTYAEIVNGTPKLSLIFELSEGFKKDKNALVSQRILTWNTLVENVRKWNQVFEVGELKACND